MFIEVVNLNDVGMIEFVWDFGFVDKHGHKRFIFGVVWKNVFDNDFFFKFFCVNGFCTEDFGYVI